MNEHELVTQLSNEWMKWYYVATYIIAVVAVVGLYISIRSSKEVSLALSTIQKGLVSLTDPLIKYSGHKWFMEGENITCDSPPTGILISYKNVSNVPVMIEESSLKVFYGEKEFKDIVSTSKHEEDGTLILSPGETLQSGTMQKELFQKHLSTPKNPMLPPNIIVEFWVHFQSLGTKEYYLYKTKQEIFFNCEQPELLLGRTIYETIEQKKA